MKNYLNKNEKIKYETGVAKREKVLEWIYFSMMALCALIFALIHWSVGLMLLSIISFRIISVYRIRYYITDKRVISKKGIINIHIKEAKLEKITDIAVKQNLINKILFNSGEVLVNTAGGNGYELKLVRIENPIQIKKLLER